MTEFRAIRVVVEDGDAAPREYTFDASFRIGRAAECEIRLDNSYVSRVHAEAVRDGGRWQVRDLNSSNGILVSGLQVGSVRIPPAATIRLGTGGPFLTFNAAAGVPRSALPEQPVVQVPSPVTAPPVSMQPTAAARPAAPVNPDPLFASPAGAPLSPSQAQTQPASLTGYIERYFAPGSAPQAAGQHTAMIRMAFTKVHRKQRSKWLAAVGALVAVVVAVGAFAMYEHQRASKQRELAEGIFYSMKSLDIDIANFERVVIETNNEGVISQLRKYQERRKDMEKQYETFLHTIDHDDARLTREQQLILRVARIFGECDLAMPADFEKEVDKYIQQWKSSGRLARAVRLARERGYSSTITRDLLAMDLPPQFFYLAVQESDLDPYISGPRTRKGIAKGMWQFIPETGVKYGLRMGPLVDLPKPDPMDDRHRWEVETKAAARYMKDLYSSDAQASGLLVMACYNWGENQVLPLVRSLPANPQERNFWKLLARYKGKLPDETYNYVFSIFSAAVIGEDPKFFGFDFDNPLQ